MGICNVTWEHLGTATALHKCSDAGAAPQSRVPQGSCLPSGVGTWSPVSTAWPSTGVGWRQLWGLCSLWAQGLAPRALMRCFPRLAWLWAWSYMPARQGLGHLAGEGTVLGQS